MTVREKNHAAPFLTVDNRPDVVLCDAHLEQAAFLLCRNLVTLVARLVQGDSYCLRMFHMHDFLVSTNVAVDELLGFLTNSQLLMHVRKYTLSFLGFMDRPVSHAI